MEIERIAISDIADAFEREMNGDGRRLRPELDGPALPARAQIIDARKDESAE